MKKKLAIKIALLAIGIPLALSFSGCSEEQDVVAPVDSITVKQSDVKMVEGRLVFSDQEAFERTVNTLRKMSASENGSQSLSSWEKTMRFVSLQASSDYEMGRLEELDIQNKPAPSYTLMQSFGFPIYYATIINPSGEYQIGDKIYWFHDGFEYEAESEKNLLEIKGNTSLAKIKYKAGSQIVKSGEIKSNKDYDVTIESNLSTLSNYPYANDKYSTTYTYLGDAGSIRRTIYAVRVYTNEKSGPSEFARYFSSGIDLLIKYEYQSLRTGKWYPRKDYEWFVWNTNFTFSGQAAAERPLGSTQYFNKTVISNGQTNKGIQTIPLAYESDVVGTAFGPYYTQDRNIFWNFEINGSISGYPERDGLKNTYTVGPGILW